MPARASGRRIARRTLMARSAAPAGAAVVALGWTAACAPGRPGGRRRARPGRPAAQRRHPDPVPLLPGRPAGQHPPPAGSVPGRDARRGGGAGAAAGRDAVPREAARPLRRRYPAGRDAHVGRAPGPATASASSPRWGASSSWPRWPGATASTRGTSTRWPWTSTASGAGCTSCPTTSTSRRRTGARSPSARASVPAPLLTNWFEVEAVLNTALEGIATGKTGVRDAVAEAKRQAEPLLAAARSFGK